MFRIKIIHIFVDSMSHIETILRSFRNSLGFKDRMRPWALSLFSFREKVSRQGFYISFPLLIISSKNKEVVTIIRVGNNTRVGNIKKRMTHDLQNSRTEDKNRNRKLIGSLNWVRCRSDESNSQESLKWCLGRSART